MKNFIKAGEMARLPGIERSASIICIAMPNERLYICRLAPQIVNFDNEKKAIHSL